MLIRSVAVARWNNDTEEPVILDAAYNLAEYSFFQRGRCAAPVWGAAHCRAGSGQAHAGVLI